MKLTKEYVKKVVHELERYKKVVRDDLTHPKIDLIDFIYSVSKICKLNNHIVCMAYTNIYRNLINNVFIYTNGTSYRLWSVSLLICSKYLVDEPYENKKWAKILCMDIDMLNSMEIDFLKRVEWHIHRIIPVN